MVMAATWTGRVSWRMNRSSTRQLSRVAGSAHHLRQQQVEPSLNQQEAFAIRCDVKQRHQLPFMAN